MTISGANRVALVGLIAGPLLAAGISSIPSQLIAAWSAAGQSAPLSAQGQITAAITAWIAIWWMTEAIPLPATSLLPLILFPLTGVLSLEATAAPYANQYIFLFLGGFMIAEAVQRWQLHRRIALLTVLAAGTSPSRLVAGFMAATAALSMWISNTASTVMMLPIGLSLVALLDEQFACTAANERAIRKNFATSLMLGIAYAASIGGLATLLGTPTNAFLAGFARQQGITITFVRWMIFATPLSLVMLVAAWLLLTKLIFPIRVGALPGGRELIRSEYAKLGGMSRGEWTVLVVFATTALCWVLREPLTESQWLLDHVPAVGRLSDAVIALIAALLLFALPVDLRKGQFALDWATAVKIPWGVLLLFGGGFSLAEAISSSGLAGWIGDQVLTLERWPTMALVVVVVAMVVFLTELTSNTPTAAAFLPILFGVAVKIQVEPLSFLVPATVAATCAFMLPVATPPNAIVFGSGRLTIGAMAVAGLWLNLLSIVLIPLWMFLWGRVVFAVEGM